MSTRRARKHQWIVLRQKAFRHVKRNQHNQHIGIPRWRAVSRVQTETEYERMVQCRYHVWLNLPQGKTKPLRLLQFTKEDNHDD